MGKTNIPIKLRKQWVQGRQELSFLYFSVNFQTMKKNKFLGNLLFSLCCFFSTSLSAQSTYFGETPVKWDNTTAVKEPSELTTYSASPLVILSDKTEFHFYAQNNERITRRLLLKINSDEGLQAL